MLDGFFGGEIAARVRCDVQAALRAEAVEGAAALARDRAEGLARIEALGDRAVSLYRERLDRAAALDPVHWLDRALRTDEPEYMDLEETLPEVREEVIEAVARLNRTFLAFPRFFRFLRPLVERAGRARTPHPVRVLEIGSGHGEFAFALDAWASDRAIPAEVTGSDVARDYLELCRDKALRLRSPVRFVDASAFDLPFDAKAFDVIVNTQTIHHFPAGLLARMLAEVGRVAAVGFLIIDGDRSPLTLAAVGAVTALFHGRAAFHDATVSIRKMYAVEELRLLAALSPTGAEVRVFRDLPGYTVLEGLRP